jgi:ribonuclease J
VGVEEKEKIPTEKGMREIGALPDDLYLDKKGLREKVRAILVSHAHLDHVGAIPYNAPRYNADVVGTNFTMEFLRILMKDNGHSIRNRIVDMKPNSTFVINGRKGKKYKAEFINITHSIPQASVIAVHTDEGVVIYTNDFKLDNSPVIGDRPNYKRLKELSRIGVRALILDCLYAPDDRKTPSEKIARGLLEDVMFGTENRNSGIIVTTFSSHIARLKTISEFGRRLNRQVVFLGRSLSKYVEAAKKAKVAPFTSEIKMVTYRKQVEKMVKKINANKKNYLVVCTGHQGEPGSILDRISKGELHLSLNERDHVIFSSKTIPTPINEANVDQLKRRLKKHKARIFDNVHVSGHGGREDLRDFINLVKPKIIIPSHGDLKKTSAGAQLAQEMGYELNKNVFLMENGKGVEI